MLLSCAVPGTTMAINTGNNEWAAPLGLAKAVELLRDLQLTKTDQRNKNHEGIGSHVSFVEHLCCLPKCMVPLEAMSCLWLGKC